MRFGLLISLAAVTLTATACTSSVGPGAGPDAGAAGKGDDPGPGSSGDGGSCASVEVAVEAEIPTVMLLIDASGSMLDPFGSTSRWQAVFDTLMHQEAGLVTLLEEDVRFGLSLYASLYNAYGQLVGSCPDTLVVPPDLENHEALYQAWSQTPIYPEYQTPTGPAIRDAAQRLAFAPEDERRVIVLATDGEPDTCTAPLDDGSPIARQESVSAVEDAHAQGIDTFVISVGDQIAEGHLQELANAGAGLPPSGGSESATFYRALDPDELVASFESIIAGVRSCDFELDNRIDAAHAETGTVELDGRVLEFETEWSLRRDGKTLVLEGAACEEWKQPGDHELSAEFTCQAIIE